MERQITAIVVDDEKDLVTILADYLKIIDVDVLGVGNNGKEAVELYEKYRPDLVFVDLMMPKYDGVYAVKNIRKRNAKADIIVITAFMRAEIARDLLALQPTKIISKPFDLSQMYDIIEQFRTIKVQAS